MLVHAEVTAVQQMGELLDKQVGQTRSPRLPVPKLHVQAQAKYPARRAKRVITASAAVIVARGRESRLGGGGGKGVE